MIFDPSNYAKSPQVSAAETVALIASLIASSVPIRAHPKVTVVLRGVRVVGESLRGVVFAPIEKATNNKREIDGSMDRIWRSIDSRLIAAFELDEPDATAARDAYAILLPDGLAFTNQRYLLQWTEGEAIFARIEAKSLEGTLNRLVGAEYLTIARTRHAAYGAAIGVTAPLEEAPPEPAVAEPLRQARASIAAYSRIVSALVEMGDISESEALQALGPIDRARAALRGRREADPAPPLDETLNTPLPEV